MASVTETAAEEGTVAASVVDSVAGAVVAFVVSLAEGVVVASVFSSVVAVVTFSSTSGSKTNSKSSKARLSAWPHSPDSSINMETVRPLRFMELLKL